MAEPLESQLEVSIQVAGNLARITLRGCVNMDTGDFLAEKIRHFVGKDGAVKFLVDVSQLEYVSSAGVGVFIDWYDKYENRGGRICFVGLQAAVRRVLQLVGFLSFFGDAQDEAEAQAYLNR